MPVLRALPGDHMGDGRLVLLRGAVEGPEMSEHALAVIAIRRGKTRRRSTAELCRCSDVCYDIPGTGRMFSVSYGVRCVLGEEHRFKTFSVNVSRYRCCNYS